MVALKGQKVLNRRNFQEMCACDRQLVGLMFDLQHEPENIFPEE